MIMLMCPHPHGLQMIYRTDTVKTEIHNCADLIGTNSKYLSVLSAYLSLKYYNCLIIVFGLISNLPRYLPWQGNISKDLSPFQIILKNYFREEIYVTGGHLAHNVDAGHFIWWLLFINLCAAAIKLQQVSFIVLLPGHMTIKQSWLPLFPTAHHLTLICFHFLSNQIS